MMPTINWDVLPDPQELAQLRDAARLPLGERLEWLEQMQRIALHLQQQRLNRLCAESEKTNNES